MPVSDGSREPVVDLSIKAAGPATEDGRISLSELSRIAAGFQATLERIAYSILIGHRRQGRSPRKVADAVRMDFIGFRAGSAVLDLERSQSETRDDMLTESFGVLEDGLKALRSNPTSLPKHFSPAVVGGLVTMCGGISSRNIREISFESRAGVHFRLNSEMRTLLRGVQRSGTQEQLTIVGRLHMGDFDPLSLRCRIDTHSGSVGCDLDDELRDVVLDLLDSLVIASGVAEMQPDGSTVRVLHLSEIESVATAAGGSLDELARQQGVEPVHDVEVMRGEPIDDFDDFMEILRSTR